MQICDNCRGNLTADEEMVIRLYQALALSTSQKVRSLTHEVARLHKRLDQLAQSHHAIPGGYEE